VVSHTPPIPKTPTVFSWGFFLPDRVIPAYSYGLPRTPADFASYLNWPFRVTFDSILSIPRSPKQARSLQIHDLYKFQN
jgi:hypothetical protein